MTEDTEQQLREKLAQLESLLGRVISQLGFDTLVELSESKVINKQVIPGFAIGCENDAALAKVKNRKAGNKHTKKALEAALKQEAIYQEQAKLERAKLRGMLGNTLNRDQMSMVLDKIKAIKSAYAPFAAFESTDETLKKLKKRTSKNVVVSKAVQEAKKFIAPTKGKKLITVKKRDNKQFTHA